MSKTLMRIYAWPVSIVLGQESKIEEGGRHRVEIGECIYSARLAVRVAHSSLGELESITIQTLSQLKSQRFAARLAHVDAARTLCRQNTPNRSFRETILWWLP